MSCIMFTLTWCRFDIRPKHSTFGQEWITGYSVRLWRKYTGFALRLEYYDWKMKNEKWSQVLNGTEHKTTLNNERGVQSNNHTENQTTPDAWVQAEV